MKTLLTFIMLASSVSFAGYDNIPSYKFEDSTAVTQESALTGAKIEILKKCFDSIDKQAGMVTDMGYRIVERSGCSARVDKISDTAWAVKVTGSIKFLADLVRH